MMGSCTKQAHEKYVKDGRCYICELVDAWPPLTDEQIARLRVLLPPVEPAPPPAMVKKPTGAQRAVDDPAKLARAARVVRLALARKQLTIAELTTPEKKPED